MRRPFALALSLFAVLSCGGDSPTEGSALSGTFDLATIDAIALPKLDRITMSLDTLYVTGGELRVLSRGRASLVRRTQWHLVTGELVPVADTVVVTYRTTGAQLFLEYPVSVPYGPYTDTASVQDNLITVRTKVYGIELGTVLVRNLLFIKR